MEFRGRPRVNALRDPRLRADSWRIDTQQLRDILEWSATASYWLLGAAGEVLVVPASHLAAIRDGAKRLRGSAFTVGYHEVRTAAIPLEQYVLDLLIGHWVGTSAETVLRFARGEDSRIRPRIIIEVQLSVGESNDLG